MKSHRCGRVWLLVITVVLASTSSFALGALFGRRGIDIMPQAAQDTFMAAYPDMRVKDVKEVRRIARLYEVTVMTPQGEREVTLTSDGVLLDVEYLVDPKRAPAAVQDAIGRVTGDSKLEELELVEIHAEFVPMALDSPRVEYEAEFVKDKAERLVRLSESGEVVRGITESEPDHAAE